jgi:hypothetical protein
MGLSQSAQKRQRKRQALAAKQRQAAFVASYSVPESLFKEAASAGVDPRTISHFRKESEKAYSEAKEIQKKSRSPGAVGSYYSSKLKGLGETVGSLASDLRGQLKSDVQKQPEFQEIRRRREKAVEQATIGMQRKRGKASLLSGEAGGAGFFQRYFK